MKNQETSKSDLQKIKDEEIEKELELVKARDKNQPQTLKKNYYDSSQSDVQKTINPDTFDLKK